MQVTGARHSKPWAPGVVCTFTPAVTAVCGGPNAPIETAERALSGQRVSCFRALWRDWSFALRMAPRVHRSPCAHRRRQRDRGQGHDRVPLGWRGLPHARECIATPQCAPPPPGGVPGWFWMAGVVHKFPRVGGHSARPRRLGFVMCGVRALGCVLWGGSKMKSCR